MVFVVEGKSGHIGFILIEDRDGSPIRASRQSTGREQQRKMRILTNTKRVKNISSSPLLCWPRPAYCKCVEGLLTKSVSGQSCQSWYKVPLDAIGSSFGPTQSGLIIAAMQQVYNIVNHFHSVSIRSLQMKVLRDCMQKINASSWECNKKKSIEQTTQIIQVTEAGQLKEKKQESTGIIRVPTAHEKQWTRTETTGSNAVPKIDVQFEN